MSREQRYLVEMCDSIGFSQDVLELHDVPTAAQAAVADGAYDLHLRPWLEDEPDSWLRVRALPPGFDRWSIAAARAALDARS